jgi:hypothetical protein
LKLLQEVEYKPEHQEKDWRNEKLPSTNSTGAISGYKIKDLLKMEP